MPDAQQLIRELTETLSQKAAAEVAPVIEAVTKLAETTAALQAQVLALAAEQKQTDDAKVAKALNPRVAPKAGGVAAQAPEVDGGHPIVKALAATETYGWIKDGIGPLA